MRAHLAATVEAIWRHDAEQLAEVAWPWPRRSSATCRAHARPREILDVMANVAIGQLSLASVFSSAGDAISVIA
jgi:hypothetical protein